MRKYTLEVVVFITGAAVMIFELTGSRVVAPYLGTSIFVWTSLIGVILASLSIGYWWGGKMADTNPHLTRLSFVVFLAALAIAITAIFKDVILSSMGSAELGVRIEAIFASITLFTPGSILLGMVFPYVVRLKMESIRTSGVTVGNLYAISTVGSILGTFLGGFFLIPYVGNTNLLFLLAIALFLVSLLTRPSVGLLSKLLMVFFLSSSMSLSSYTYSTAQKNGFIDIDTEYNRVLIYQGFDEKAGRRVQYLTTDAGVRQSAIFLDNDGELVFDYLKFFRLVKHFNPQVRNALMIGGGAYSYPKDFLRQLSNAEIDVVEIDPKIAELARQYFYLRDNPRLHTYHEDGRRFLNKTKNKYDAVFIDAFFSYIPPFQLTTKEVVQKIYNSLDPNGIVLVNIVSAIDGERGKFLRAEYATYESIFPQVYIFPVSSSTNGSKIQNIILAAVKSNKPVIFDSQDSELKSYLKNVWRKQIENDAPILSDDRAPVEHYVQLMGKFNSW